MRIIKQPNEESKFALAKCEHCLKMDEYTGQKPIEDTVCKHCGMTTDKD